MYDYVPSALMYLFNTENVVIFRLSEEKHDILCFYLIGIELSLVVVRFFDLAFLASGFSRFSSRIRISFKY